MDNPDKNNAISKEQKINGRKERRLKLSLPAYTLGEEIFSAITHGVGALLGVAALVVLLVFCRKEPLVITAVSIYGGTMILLYTVSTIYHGLNLNVAKKVFRTLDHCTIFLLIAGTYTPITLVCLGGTQGWVMFSVVWAAAAVGIVLNGISVKKFAKISMVCYIAMGWVIVFAMKTFYINAGLMSVIYLGVGGFFYMVGAALYGVGKKVPYIHSVWHIFVLAGSLFHFLMIFQIVTV